MTVCDLGWRTILDEEQPEKVRALVQELQHFNKGGHASRLQFSCRQARKGNRLFHVWQGWHSIHVPASPISKGNKPANAPAGD
jgi:hypothetical protein